MKKYFFQLVVLSVLALGVLTSCGDCPNKSKKDGKEADKEIVTANANVTKEAEEPVVQENAETDENAETGTEETAQAEISSATADGEVHQLTSAEFIANIFDYKTNKEWTYKGSGACVIDFYADWCKPCKMVAPIMDELAKEYEGKITFYKVNVDNEGELASVFGIQSIPSVLFVPANGDQPQMSVGAMDKAGYQKSIEDTLLK